MSILFTGGGSAGHVTPNLALIKQCQAMNWKINYIGSHDGIEKTLVTRENIPYFEITTGKIRRQLTLKNLLTPLNVLVGIFQAVKLCRRIKPQLVFSKGGFVAFPVVVAAWLNRIPVIAHESDFSPGLANRLSYPFAKTICLTFAETKRFFKRSNKTLVTGTPLREELFAGDAERGKHHCNFSDDKKILLIIGGGLGAERVNHLIRRLLPELLPTFNIIHLCGKGKVDESIKHEGYRQFDYVHQELADYLACATLVVSRAGANSLYELLALHKPHVLIPLSQVSRGDQVHNANYFANKGLSYVVDEMTLTDEHFMQVLTEACENRAISQKKMAEYNLQNGTPAIMKLLQQQLGESSYEQRASD